MKCIVSLSGGLDSTTVLAEALSQGREVEAVVFTYASKHNKHENIAAFNVADHYGVPARLIDLSAVMAGFRSNLLKSGGAIPEGHYEAESMKLTVVPGRNTIFASVLMGLAESVDAGEVWLGIHAGDHAIYPDCRPEWLRAMNQVAEAATEGKVRFVAPFLLLHKQGILQRGVTIDPPVPYHLTRTCYKDSVKACGRCGSCQERLTAFSVLGREDPIEYAGGRDLLPK